MKLKQILKPLVRHTELKDISQELRIDK